MVGATIASSLQVYQFLLQWLKPDSYNCTNSNFQLGIKEIHPKPQFSLYMSISLNNIFVCVSVCIFPRNQTFLLTEHTFPFKNFFVKRLLNILCTSIIDWIKDFMSLLSCGPIWSAFIVQESLVDLIYTMEVWKWSFHNVRGCGIISLNSITQCHPCMMKIKHHWKAEEHKHCFALNSTTKFYAAFW